MAALGEILVLPFFGQGHLFPCIELCNHLSSRHYKPTLLITANLSSSIPSSFRDNPSVQFVEINGSSPPPGPNHFHRRHQQMAKAMDSVLSARYNLPDSIRPVCAVIDVMMSWSKEIFVKFNVPAVSLFTSGACAAAIEYAAWKAKAGDMKPGEIQMLPGLPEDMTLTYSDITRWLHPPLPIGGNGEPPAPPAGMKFGPPGGMKFGPPRPGQRPPWVDEIEGSAALLINTCEDLERPFIDYVASQTGRPVWGVGPLLPELYWKSDDSVVHDRGIRPRRQSNFTEHEVILWLDSKPRGSVIYVAFGSEVGPTMEDYAQLADAMAESKWAFIWVLQPGTWRSGPPPAMLGGKPGSDGMEEGYCPRGLEGRVGDRGLIIRGWAPQLMILSHPSTGGFLSHCGWNSIVEAIGRGVPILAWPLRGDQFYNAKLVTCHLKVGYMVSNRGQSETVKKDDIVQGIEMLMNDEDVHNRAADLHCKLWCAGGFPASSMAALDAFSGFIVQKATQNIL